MHQSMAISEKRNFTLTINDVKKFLTEKNWRIYWNLTSQIYKNSSTSKKGIRHSLIKAIKLQDEVKEKSGKKEKEDEVKGKKGQGEWAKEERTTKLKTLKWKKRKKQKGVHFTIITEN